MKRHGLYLLIYLTVVAVLLFVGFADRAYDDPFITYRYAWNLRSGHGFVYNTNERVQSTTTPLYTLLLALLSHLWRDLPRLSNLISAVSLAIGGFFVHRYCQSLERPVAGLAGAVLLPLSPLLVNTFGAETCFYTMLILGALTFYAQDRLGLAAGFAAAATLTRADGMLVAAVLGLDFLVRHRRVPWRPLLVYVVVTAPWYLFAWVYFGSPIPVTLSAKQHQGEMAISQSFVGGLLDLLRGRAAFPRYWLQGGLLILGIADTLFVRRRCSVIFFWGVLYIAAYAALGVSRYFWYYAPLVAASVTAIALGLEILYRWVGRLRLKSSWREVGVIVCLCLVAVPQAHALVRLRQYPDSRASIYREVGAWLDANTSQDASVGALEIGIIGYYARRRMVDFAGLIQPEVAHQMALETTYADTARWAVKRYQPDYLVLDPRAFPDLADSLTNTSCVALKTFQDARYGGELRVYRCEYGDLEQANPEAVAFGGLWAWPAAKAGHRLPNG